MSDELYDTRPKWLSSISSGVWLILLSILLGAATPLILVVPMRWLMMWSRSIGWRWNWQLDWMVTWGWLDLTAVLFFVGV